MNAQFTRDFMKRSQTDPRFAGLRMASRTGNVLVVTGKIDTRASYEAFVELGRRCGFLVLCDALTIRESYSASPSSAAETRQNGASARDPMSIFHLLPKPPEEDPLGEYTYFCGDCVVSFFNEEGHRHIQRHGAWCEHCGEELVLSGA
jgi:hypothetical protein